MGLVAALARDLAAFNDDSFFPTPHYRSPLSSIMLMYSSSFSEAGLSRLRGSRAFGSIYPGDPDRHASNSRAKTLSIEIALAT